MEFIVKIRDIRCPRSFCAGNGLFGPGGEGRQSGSKALPRLKVGTCSHWQCSASAEHIKSVAIFNKARVMNTNYVPILRKKRVAYRHDQGCHCGDSKWHGNCSAGVERKGCQLVSEAW